MNFDEAIATFGFGSHYGYGTPAHIDVLTTQGPSEIHRHSFLRKILGKTIFNVA